MPILLVPVALLCLFGPWIEAQSAFDSGDYAEVRKMLEEIQIESIKRHGIFSDEVSLEALDNELSHLQDPTKAHKRMELPVATFKDGTEASANRQFAMELFETDILLTLPQAKHILSEVKTGDELNLLVLKK